MIALTIYFQKNFKNLDETIQRNLKKMKFEDETTIIKE